MPNSDFLGLAVFNKYGNKILDEIIKAHGKNVDANTLNALLFDKLLKIFNVQMALPKATPLCDVPTIRLDHKERSGLLSTSFLIFPFAILTPYLIGKIIESIDSDNNLLHQFPTNLTPCLSLFIFYALYSFVHIPDNETKKINSALLASCNEHIENTTHALIATVNTAPSPLGINFVLASHQYIINEIQKIFQPLPYFYSYLALAVMMDSLKHHMNVHPLYILRDVLYEILRKDPHVKSFTPFSFNRFLLEILFSTARLGHLSLSTIESLEPIDSEIINSYLRSAEVKIKKHNFILYCSIALFLCITAAALMLNNDKPMDAINPHHMPNILILTGMVILFAFFYSIYNIALINNELLNQILKEYDKDTVSIVKKCTEIFPQSFQPNNETEQSMKINNAILPLFKESSQVVNRLLVGYNRFPRNALPSPPDTEISISSFIAEIKM